MRGGLTPPALHSGLALPSGVGALRGQRPLTLRTLFPEKSHLSGPDPPGSQAAGWGRGEAPRRPKAPLPASTVCSGQDWGPHTSAACSVGPRPVTSPFWASVSPCVTCRGGMGWSIICHSQKNVGEKNNGIGTKQCYYIPVCAVC